MGFYFDYISSNAYLAWFEVQRIAAAQGARLEPIPVLCAGLLEAHGQLGPAEVGPKAAWMWRNCLRKAALLGVPLELAHGAPGSMPECGSGAPAGWPARHEETP